ncbi:MAG TPA: hypothetical protein DC084_10210 [Cupriavidus sp.]|nr:hypothetical protein [Cupriavidus sp.]
MKRQLFARAFAGAVLLGSAAALAPAAMAQVSINIGIGVPPPAPVYEVVPPPRVGYVWSPGYWDWDDHGHKHAWKKGHWVSERPGYVYEQPRWVRASNGWVLQPERWNRGPGRGDDDDQGHGHDHDRGRGGYHCPPGHAKKGEC